MPNFKTIHTTYGLQRLAQAESTGTPINLPQIAVGDGNGNSVFPTEGQTQLVREMFRAAPNRVYPDPTDNTRFIAEIAIPASVSGFTLREIGIFDDQGGLFAVGNLPETYKPMASDGAFTDTVARMVFMVTNAGVIVVQMDPNVAVVTQSWITNNVNVGKLIPGGLTGQVLRKHSNADGDTEWADPTQANVVVNTVEEPQTLAAGQTVVNLALANTYGLAVYVEGVRLVRGTEWTPHATILTRLTLAQSYPAGTSIIAVQNEPASHLTQALQRDQNLADVADAPTARTNLGVYSKAETDAVGKVAGEVFYTARSTAPAGSLKANGAAISRTAYAALFGAIGTTYGAGDGFNTFNLPDLRGEFLRGLDDGRGVDAGRVLGSAQTSQNLAHTHNGSTDTSGSHSHSYTDGRPVNPGGNGIAAGSQVPSVWERIDQSTTGAAGSHSHGITTNSSGGAEARPRNIALLACIKY
jgi:phage-related tail fiber protein